MRQTEDHNEKLDPHIEGERDQTVNQMKIISWNIKGILRKYKTDIVMVQEIKKPSCDKRCFLSFWGGRNKEWAFTPAEGTAE